MSRFLGLSLVLRYALGLVGWFPNWRGRVLLAPRRALGWVADGI